MRDSDQEWEDIRQILIAALIRRMPEAGDCGSAIDGVSTFRRDSPMQLTNTIYRPLVLLVVQGFKSSLVGNQRLEYSSGQYMLTGVDMPSVSHVIEAEADKPYLSIVVHLDRAVIGQLLLEVPCVHAKGENTSGMCVARAELDTLRAFHRLIEVLEKPEDLPVIGPMVIKELHYRLLKGLHGNQLRLLNTPGTQARQIAWAVSWLRENFNTPLRIEELAKKASLSESTLHRQFKKVTTMSPLQYQKRLRLHEAQRLMLAENMDANSASLAVGYESPHQFNREYKRLFGQPPHKDISARHCSPANYRLGD